MSAPLTFNGITLDLPAHEMLLDGDVAARLAPCEVTVARLLFATPGHTVRRERIEGALWSGRRDSAMPKTLDVLVYRLRRKFRDRGIPARIITHYGVGYSIAPLPRRAAVCPHCGQQMRAAA